MTIANPREDQYEAAAAAARRIVDHDMQRLAGFAFHLDTEVGVPSVLWRWASTFAEELEQRVIRKCYPDHGGWAEVRTVFGSQPNVAHCYPNCTKTRMRRLLRDVRYGGAVTCDFCHVEANHLSPVVFDVAAVVVRMKVCAYCLLGELAPGARS